MSKLNVLDIIWPERRAKDLLPAEEIVATISIYSGYPSLTLLTYSTLPIGIGQIIIFWLGRLTGWSESQGEAAFGFLWRQGIAFFVIGLLCVGLRGLTNTRKSILVVTRQKFYLIPVQKWALKSDGVREYLATDISMSTRPWPLANQVHLGTTDCKMLRHAAKSLSSIIYGSA